MLGQVRDDPVWRIPAPGSREKCLMARIPTRKRWLEDAVMPMCQSPKIVNVLVHTKRLPANDNCSLAETGVNSFRARGPTGAGGPAFLGLLCVSVLLLVRKVALGMRRIL